MADETRTNTSPTTGDTSSQTPTESVKEEKAKTNTLLIILIVLGVLIVGIASFFAGQSMNSTDATPTPTVVQNTEATVEPTQEESTPTEKATETPTPTENQQSTPTSSQNMVTPTVATQ